ncbi:hypothetical protein AKJ56_02360, partial [candidate division MSBL1 archaeon SCGC-AAA382N08]
MSDEQEKSGLLLINKPQGPTSHDIVDRVREITGVEKVGHTGTLDPQASGLLILLVSREATKQQNKFLNLRKEYEAIMKLGEETDTLEEIQEFKELYQQDEKAEKLINLGKKLEGVAR